MSSSGRVQSTNAESPIEDAVLGLITLGYKESEARKAINTVSTDPDTTPEGLIRASLKQMLTTP